MRANHSDPSRVSWSMRGRLSGCSFSAIGIANALADAHNGLRHMPLHSSYTDAQLLRYLPITQFFNTLSQIYLFRPGRQAVDSQTVTLPHLVHLRRCVWRSDEPRVGK